MSKEIKPAFDALSCIQAELRAPKGQENKFGHYNYRSCEDILEAVKPLLNKHGALLTLNDEIVLIGDRVYIKSTAKFGTGDKSTIIRVDGFAREPQNKKGMDESQITGACSSYARKYALNGLFLIDDTKDADTQAPPETAPKATATPKVKPVKKTTKLPLQNSYIQEWKDWIDKGFDNEMNTVVRQHIEKTKPAQAVKDYFNTKLQESKQ